MFRRDASRLTRVVVTRFCLYTSEVCRSKRPPDDLQNYLTDASNMPGGHATSFSFLNLRTRYKQIVKEANDAAIPVTVSGARTGTVGGAVPFGGYVISMERLNKIKSIDRERQTAVVGARGDLARPSKGRRCRRVILSARPDRVELPDRRHGRDERVGREEL